MSNYCLAGPIDRAGRIVRDDPTDRLGLIECAGPIEHTDPIEHPDPVAPSSNAATPMDWVAA